VQKCAPSPDVSAQKLKALSKKQNGGAIETRHPFLEN